MHEHDAAAQETHAVATVSGLERRLGESVRACSRGRGNDSHCSPASNWTSAALNNSGCSRASRRGWTWQQHNCTSTKSIRVAGWSTAGYRRHGTRDATPPSAATSSSSGSACAVKDSNQHSRHGLNSLIVAPAGLGICFGGSYEDHV